MMGNNTYVYKEGDISGEARYHNGRLWNFIGNLGYFRECTPIEEVGKKNLKHLIGIQLLFPEREKTIFGKIQNIWILSFSNLPIRDVFSISIFVCRSYE